MNLAYLLHIFTFPFFAEKTIRRLFKEVKRESEAMAMAFRDRSRSVPIATPGDLDPEPSVGEVIPKNKGKKDESK